MQYIVPNLYDNLNLTTLPEIIKEEFYKLGFWMHSSEDIFFKPYFSIYEFDTNKEKIKFYAHENSIKTVNDYINNKKLLNENYELLTFNELLKEYIKEYGRGFYKGYENFSNELKNKTNLIFETNNKQLAFKVFSKVIKKTGFRIIESFPLSFIPMQDIELVNKKFNKEADYYCVDKDTYHKSGFESGEKYKAWELILHNPTLFEDIFIEQLSKPEPKEDTFIEEVIIETPNLKLKNIPNFNLQQRFYIFQKLELDNHIHKIDTDKQSSKHKILAILMGISPDNAKHLVNNTYKDLTPEQQAEVDEYLLLQKIKL